MASGNLSLAQYFLQKRRDFLAVAILAAAIFLLLAPQVSEAKIDDADLKKIETVLDIANFPVLSNYSGEQIKEVLNKIINYEEKTDISYGILIFAAFDEIEFMDMVLTQSYKERGRAYFDSVLDKKINMLSHWKGVGNKFYSVAARAGSASPMTLLAAESISMTNKVIDIFKVSNAIRDMKRYDGLWVYFDWRKNGNEPHRVAWEGAEAVMGFAAVDGWSFSYKKPTDQNSFQLEQQFLSLYEKWGPYVTPYGISKEYKKQLAGEFRNTLASALETRQFAKEEPKVSLITRLMQQIQNLKNQLAALVGKVNPFRAGPVLEIIESDQPKLASAQAVTSAPLPAPEVALREAELAALEATVEELMDVGHPLIEPEIVQDGEAQPLQSAPDETRSDPVSLCQASQGGAPKQYRVLINEVGWMGTKNSSNDEYIKLKNILGVPVDLAGWQIQDKDRQIKIILEQGKTIPAEGFLVLERTDDSTLPDIQADFIYTGALNDADEALYLFDNNCQVEDQVIAEPSWPAGDKTQKLPMQRFDTMNWYTENNLPLNLLPGRAEPLVSSASAPTPGGGQGAGDQAPSFNIVINEIAWAGNAANSADEWLELYNNTASPLDLTGWKIKKGGEDWLTLSTSTISAQGYYLIERTDDNAVSDIAADNFFIGSLSNGGEKLELRDAQDNLIDLMDASGGWFAGQASPYYSSMERIDAAANADVSNWASNNRVPWDGWLGKDSQGNRLNGTPKSKNSVSKTSTIVSQSGFSISDNFIMTKLGSPYLIEGSILVLTGAKLTIEPGVALKFKHNYGWSWQSELKVEGELLAVGGDSQDQKIIFTSFKDDEYGGDTNNDGFATQPALGDWQWLYLANASSTLKNAIIRYGGKLEGNPPQNPYFTQGAVYIDGGTALIENSVIEKSETLGIWLKNSTSTLIAGTEFRDINTSWTKPAAVYIENSSPTIKDSVFRDNNIGILAENFSGPSIKNNNFEGNQIPIKISTLLPVVSGNTMQGNDYNGIFLASLSLPAGLTSKTWPASNLPYIIDSLGLAAGLTINIEPGTVIKLKSGSRIYVDGILKAEGLPENKIVFTSVNAQPAAGNWDYIAFTAPGSVLNNVVVQYGGFLGNRGGVGTQDGAIKIISTTLTVKDSVIENNLVGMESINSDFTGQTDNVIVRNSKIGVYVSGACPNLTGMTISDSENYDVFPDCQ